MDPNQNQQSFQFIANDEFLNLLCDRDIGKQMHLQDEQIALSKYYNQHQGCDQEQQWIFGANNHNEFEMRFEQVPQDNPFFNERRDQRAVSFFGAQMLMPKEQQKKPKEKEIIDNNKELFLANQSKSIYLSKISQLLKDSELSSAKEKHSVSPSSKNQQKISRKYTSSKEYDDSGSEKFVQNERLAKNRESARNSRKRKKVYVELLENKVAELSDELKNTKELCQKQLNYINKFTENVEHVNKFNWSTMYQFQQFLDNQQQWILKAGQLVNLHFSEGNYQQNFHDLRQLEKNIVCQTNEMLLSQCQKILGNCIQFPINHLLEGLNVETILLANSKNMINDVYTAFSNLQDQVEQLSSQFQNVLTNQQHLQTLYERLMSECSQQTHQYLLSHILDKFQKQQETTLESSGGVLQNLQRKLIKRE